MGKAGIIELENQRAILGTRAVEFADKLERQKEHFEAEILRLNELIAAQAETIKELEKGRDESKAGDGGKWFALSQPEQWVSCKPTNAQPD